MLTFTIRSKTQRTQYCLLSEITDPNNICLGQGVQGETCESVDMCWHVYACVCMYVYMCMHFMNTVYMCVCLCVYVYISVCAPLIVWGKAQELKVWGTVQESDGKYQTINFAHFLSMLVACAGRTVVQQHCACSCLWANHCRALVVFVNASLLFVYKWD